MTRRATLSRRQALGVLGAAGAGLLVGRRQQAAAGSCTVPPAQTEGPYFVDELLQRVDIRVDPSDGSVRPGVPLRLRITVLRADDGCRPAAGLQVDVWHTDAAGRYSDEADNGTVGKKFLRGYQLTDASGTAEFLTVYPGWYPGRTVHIHFKVRAFDDGEETYEFTSQLYFDDAITDQVFAQSPYSGRGARNTRNAQDGIFGGTSALLLGLNSDGAGGWVGSFTAGLEGLPATNLPLTCADLATCRAAVASVLPDSNVSDAKRRRVARRLARLHLKAEQALAAAPTAGAARQARLYRKARAALRKLLAVARAADARGTLGGSLPALTQAVGAVLALLPAA